MSHEFRIRFHLLPEDRIDASDAKLALPGDAGHLRLVAWSSNSVIADSPQLFLVGGPYLSSEEATNDGLRARRALLLWALQRRLAVDLGDGKRRSGLTPAGVAHFSAQLGGPVRQQLHGLDVYEREENQKFIDIKLQPGLRINATTAVAAIGGWYEINRQLTDKQALAAELFCTAHFDAPFRSRFLTLMTALEALLDHAPRPAAVKAVVSSLEAAVNASQLAPGAKRSLLSSLEWLHNESIGQAGRRTARELLGEEQYGGMSAEKYFQESYTLRSIIVHSGRVPDSVELLDASNELHRFAGDLLHAHIGLQAS